MYAKVFSVPNIPIFQPNCTDSLHFSAFLYCDINLNNADIIYGTFRIIVPFCYRLRSVPFCYHSPFRFITIFRFVSFAA